MLPERATVPFVKAISQVGASTHAREKLLIWQATTNGVSVTTHKSYYQAVKLIITSSALSGGLISMLYNIALPERQVLPSLQPKQTDIFTQEKSRR